MPETNYFWDPLTDNILQERDDTGAVTAEYTTEPDLYGNLISQDRQGVESQYHFDALGSTLALTGDNQQVTDTYAYSAFGEVTDRSGSTVNPFQYVGQSGYFRYSRFVCLYIFLCAAQAFVAQPQVGNGLHATEAEKSNLETSLPHVLDWLDDEPRQARDEPPNDNIRDLRLKWIERGRKIPHVEEVLIRILRDKTSPHRSLAALVVGRVGSAKALDALKDTFDTDDPRLQLNALESIRVIDSPRRVEVLAAALESTYRQSETSSGSEPTSKAIVRANVAIALAGMEDSSARQLLRRLLAAERDPYVLNAVKKLESNR